MNGHVGMNGQVGGNVEGGQPPSFATSASAVSPSVPQSFARSEPESSGVTGTSFDAKVRGFGSMKAEGTTITIRIGGMGSPD
jgi:hypothetical protein